MNWHGTIPIYINNFNWLTWPKALAEFFADVPQTDVIIIDNASTYPPLLDWYAEECPCKVVRLEKNGGHHAPWKQSVILPAPVHRAMFGSEFYVVTDADLCFDGCPKNLLDILIGGFQRLPTANKVGVSLEIDDLPEDSLLGSRARRWEQKFWRNRLDHQFYQAAVDTTFALYAIETPHRKAMQCNQNSLRSDRPYTVRHMPWYLRAGRLTEEQRYYFDSSQCGKWSQMARRMLQARGSATTMDATATNPSEMFGLSPADLASFEADWRISNELLRVLCELLRSLRLESILETGAGASSLLFYHYQRARPGTVFLSHDEAGRWNDRLMEHVHRLGFPSSCIAASSIRNGFYERTAPGVEANRPFDLILYDGPTLPRHRDSGNGRAFLEQNGSCDSVFIIDDTNRPREASIASFLQNRFGRRAFRSFRIHDQTYKWRFSTILIPQKKLRFMRSSPVWRALATPTPRRL